MPGPDGTVMHAEVSIGNSRLMLGEPMQTSASTSSFYVYVADVDSMYKRATGRRRQIGQSADRSVLGRPNGHGVRPVWKYLVDRHAQRGSDSRGDGQADGGSESLDRNCERGILPSRIPRIISIRL